MSILQENSCEAAEKQEEDTRTISLKRRSRCLVKAMKRIDVGVCGTEEDS